MSVVYLVLIFQRLRIVRFHHRQPSQSIRIGFPQSEASLFIIYEHSRQKDLFSTLRFDSYLFFLQSQICSNPQVRLLVRRKQPNQIWFFTVRVEWLVSCSFFNYFCACSTSDIPVFTVMLFLLFHGHKAQVSLTFLKGIDLFEMKI